jgi:hypothetical protein
MSVSPGWSHRTPQPMWSRPRARRPPCTSGPDPMRAPSARARDPRSAGWRAQALGLNSDRCPPPLRPTRLAPASTCRFCVDKQPTPGTLQAYPPTGWPNSVLLCVGTPQSLLPFFPLAPANLSASISMHACPGEAWSSRRTWGFQSSPADPTPCSARLAAFRGLRSSTHGASARHKDHRRRPSTQPFPAIPRPPLATTEAGYPVASPTTLPAPTRAP